MPDTYRDPQRLARIVAIALALFFFCDVMFTAAEINTIRSIDRYLAGIGDMSELEAADMFSGLTGLGVVIMMLFVVVVLCMWIHRVNKNAQAFDHHGVMTVSPGWNVGYFFIPFANLLMPFRGLAETYRVSANPAEPTAVAIPGLMRLWWGCWLVSGVLGNISFRLSLSAETLETFKLASQINVTSFVFDMPALATLVWFVRKLTDHQQQELLASDMSEPALGPTA
jgi:hypothetical protein